MGVKTRSMNGVSPAKKRQIDSPMCKPMSARLFQEARQRVIKAAKEQAVKEYRDGANCCRMLEDARKLDLDGDKRGAIKLMAKAFIKFAKPDSLVTHGPKSFMETTYGVKKNVWYE